MLLQRIKYFGTCLLMFVAIGSYADYEARAQNDRPDLDGQLAELLAIHNVQPIETPSQDPTRVRLGQALFFDRELSGNRDVACATCHHPRLSTTDNRPLGIGTGTPTLGAIGHARLRGEGRAFIPRNAPDTFNRGAVHWRTQFWDGRIEQIGDVLVTPAGPELPLAIDTVLEAQAMFPVTSRDEMRGSLVDGEHGNEIARLNNSDFTGIWNSIMVRLMSHSGYRQMFTDAFPDLTPTELGFEHAAKAIAAFEIAAFSFDDSPFDEYLRGDSQAMTTTAKRGAILFYGKAGCADCHSGTLLTDQQHHNLALPQFGPGKDPLSGLDLGRFGVTGQLEDLFRFRTPPLRNVVVTGPWMHNGAYSSLDETILHHLDAVKALRKYKAKHHLDDLELHATVVSDKDVFADLTEQVDISKIKLNAREVGELLSFMEALTAPNLDDRLRQTIPSSVPSGLVESGE